MRDQEGVHAPVFGLGNQLKEAALLIADNFIRLFENARLD
jgi:hypothetical protein